MATAPGSVDPEVLEQGTAGSSRRPRRLSAVLWVVALALTVGAVLVDSQVRRREQREVARCAAVATTTVTTASGRLTVMVKYVGPSLAGSPPGRLREALLDMVSASAAPAAGPLRRARDQCTATRVLPFHAALRRSRDDCVRLLSGIAAYLRAVARNGTAAYELNDTSPGRCRARPA
ncbi:MAG TPA: hypothetical protein VER39_02685 [Nocardioidaceae bacterium]|nr:hypothetical protein [Nocardioidaceae bacterium]